MLLTKLLPKKHQRKYGGTSVFHNTVNNFLNKMLSKPRRLRKPFYLNEKYRKVRNDFCEKIMEMNIKG